MRYPAHDMSSDLFYFVVEFGAGFEFHNFAGCDFDGFFGAGVDTGAGSFFADSECAETEKGNFVTLGESGGNCIESSIESFFCIYF